MLPILAVLAGARTKALTLSQLVATLPARQARSNRLEHVPFEASAAFIAGLADASAAQAYFAPVGTVAERSDIDGPRFVLQGGEVVHYRPSGNAPELRCYTEAASAERAEALLAWGLAAAESAIR
jgi:phosphomannomutase